MSESIHLLDKAEIGYSSLACHSDVPTINSEKEKRMRYISLAIAVWGIFVSFDQFSIYWTSLWPYLSQIDPTSTPAFLGVAISSYGVGNSISSPLMGLWGNRLRSIKIPVITCLVTSIFGNFLMCFAESFDRPKYAILCSRIVVGVGSGALGPFMSYGAEASFPNERNRVTSYQSSAFSSACFFGPGIMALMSLVGYPGIVIGQFRFNMYTLPGYFSGFLSFATIFLMLFVFKDYSVGVDNTTEDDEVDEDVSFDMVAGIACIWCRFVITFCVVFDDTIGSIMTMIMFNWTRTQAIMYNGMINTVGGMMDFGGNIVVGNIILKYVKERNLIIFGIFSYMLFYLFSFSYPNLPILGEVTLCTGNTSTSTVTPGTYDLHSTESSSSFWNLSASTKAPTCLVAADLNRTVCSFDWCKDTTRISLWSYVVAFFFLYLAFTTCYAPSVTLFSKVLGPRRQGVWQGINMGAQSLAAAISPLIVSMVFEAYGPRTAWLIGIGILVFSLIFLLAAYKRLIPHNNYNAAETNDTALSIYDECSARGSVVLIDR